MFCFLSISNLEKRVPSGKWEPIFQSENSHEFERMIWFFLSFAGGEYSQNIQNSWIREFKISCWPKPSWRIVRSWYFLESLLDHGSDIQHLPPTFFLPNLKKSKNIQNLWIGEFDIVDVMNYRVFHVKVSESKPIYG